MTLQEQDPEIYDLIKQEKQRQVRGIELIASEVRSHFRERFAHMLSARALRMPPQPPSRDAFPFLLILPELHLARGDGGAGELPYQQVL